MWLGERTVSGRTPRQTDVGRVTIGGGSAAVYTNLEKRRVATYAPGGYFWLPKQGENTLLVRAADGETCIAGRSPGGCPETIAPGEICIASEAGAARVWFKNDGSIAVTGSLVLEGSVQVNGGVSVNGTVQVTGGLYVNGNSVG